MNYNEIVGRFAQVVEDHKMLVDFGYGQISDIKTRSEGMGEAEGADYPYLFLNPGVHQREENMITYNFNMIIMDMAREEEGNQYQNFLNIQSDCIQYCDDVIARLYYHYKDQPEISFDVSYTPFYERFQDDLAGATAVIQIMVPNSINECIAPFEGKVIGNFFTNPNEDGTNDFHQAFLAGQRTGAYPEYDWVYNEFAPWYVSNQTPYDYSTRRAAGVINDDPDVGGEGLVPYWNVGSRHVTIPTDWSGTLRFEYDLELTNVQGADLSDDRFRWQVVINGQEQFYVDVPNLPTDGTPVPFKETFDYVAEAGREDEVVILFRYNDEGAPAPDGPVVGFRGSFKLIEL